MATEVLLLDIPAITDETLKDFDAEARTRALGITQEGIDAWKATLKSWTEVVDNAFRKARDLKVQKGVHAEICRQLNIQPLPEKGPKNLLDEGWSAMQIDFLDFVGSILKRRFNEDRGGFALLNGAPGSGKT
jgi:hypothetical protein